MNKFAGLIIPFGLAAVSLGGYYAYWARAADAIEVAARQALPTAQSVTVAGFPFRLTLLAKGIKINSASGLRFSATQVEATASPFNPELWVLVGASDPKLGLPSGPERPLVATDLKASLRFAKGQPSRFSMVFVGLEAKDEGGGDGGWRTGEGKFHLLADPKDASRMALSADLTGLVLAHAPEGPGAILGEKINHIRLAGPITKAPALLSSARNWAQAGGALEVMSGEVLWGPVAFTKATGTLSLTQGGQWSGTLKGEGALQPEGLKLDGLTADVALTVRDGQLSILGMPGLRLPSAFQ